MDQANVQLRPVLCRMSNSNGEWERYETAKDMARAKGIDPKKGVGKILRIAAKTCTASRPGRPPTKIGGGHWSKPGWNVKFADDQSGERSESITDSSTDVQFNVGDSVCVDGTAFANSATDRKYYGRVSAVFQDGRARPFEVQLADGATHHFSSTDISMETLEGAQSVSKRKASDDQMTEALAAHSSRKRAMESIGLAPNGDNYARVNRLLLERGMLSECESSVATSEFQHSNIVRTSKRRQQAAAVHERNDEEREETKAARFTEVTETGQIPCKSAVNAVAGLPEQDFKFVLSMLSMSTHTCSKEFLAAVKNRRSGGRRTQQIINSQRSHGEAVDCRRLFSSDPWVTFPSVNAMACAKSVSEQSVIRAANGESTAAGGGKGWKLPTAVRWQVRWTRAASNSVRPRQECNEEQQQQQRRGAKPEEQNEQEEEMKQGQDRYPQRQQTRCKQSSHFKGVHWVTQGRYWCAQLYHKGRCTYVGRFTSEVAAAKAWDCAAAKAGRRDVNFRSGRRDAPKRSRTEQVEEAGQSGEELRCRPVLCRWSDSDGEWERFASAQEMARAKGVRAANVIQIAAKICVNGRVHPPTKVGGGHWSKPGWNVKFADDESEEEGEQQQQRSMLHHQPHHQGQEREHYGSSLTASQHYTGPLLQLNSRVCVRFADPVGWFPGRVTKILSANKFRVFFDDGETHDVHSNYIQLLTEKTDSSQLVEAAPNSNEETGSYRTQLMVPSLQCAVCMEHFDTMANRRVYKLPCSHSFCVDCIETWISEPSRSGRPTCPSCRRAFVSLRHCANADVDRVVHSAQGFLSGCDGSGSCNHDNKAVQSGNTNDGSEEEDEEDEGDGEQQPAQQQQQQNQVAARAASRASSARGRRTWGSSRFVGVTWNKSEQKWKAQLHDRGNTISLYAGDDEEAAARAWDAAAAKIGRTNLNFPADAV